ncbi:MAG: TonB-dependent receptor, partial [Pseudomonadales bacterium]
HNQIKYIGAYREVDFDDGNDIDGAPISFTTVPFGPNLYFQRHTNISTTSHEIQWVGDIDRLNYVLGYYYYEDEGDTWGPQDFFGSTARDDYGADTKASAWFMQFDYELTDKLTATVGFRQTEEEKSGYTRRFNTDGFNGPRTGAFVINVSGYKAQWNSDTPVFALRYALTDDLSLYARAAKGFKSGGFSSELTDPVSLLMPFDPEEAWTYEAGIKASLFDNRAKVSAAVFRNEITDFQTTQLIPGGTGSSSFVTNAGEATYQGIELEGTFLVSDGWTVQFGYGYLDAEFGEFMDNPIDFDPVSGNYFTNSSAALIDTGSNRVAPYAPEHTLNLNLDGRLAQTEIGELRLIVDYTFISSNYLYAANKSLDAPNAGGQYLADLVEIPDAPMLNARLLLSGIPMGCCAGEAQVSIFGRNLTDFDDRQPAIDFGGFIDASWPTPRTYGVAVDYSW